MPFAANISDEDGILQQDNASIHTSSATNDWLKSKNTQVLDWPLIFSNLNTIKNDWGLLVRALYAND